MTMNDAESNPTNQEAAIVSGTWTQYLPQAFGIREMFESTPFRWCARESLMWGIATGTTMGLHRLRMGSKPNFALNISFLTFNLVAIPSYYFCYRKRQHKEEMIELMMKANDFAPLDEMPQSIPLTEDHPFLLPEQKQQEEPEDATTNSNLPQPIPSKEYRAWFKEFKEWQKPTQQQQAQDLETIFQPVDAAASEKKEKEP